MFSVVTVDDKEDEVKMIRSSLKELAANLTEDEWSIKFFKDNDEWNSFLMTEPVIDIACMDIVPKGRIEELMSYRRHYSDNGLLIITDVSMSPLIYLRPGIRPDSLLMRPLSEENIEATIKEFVKEMIDKRNNSDSSNYFVLDSQEGRTFLLYKDIFYFEARDKKIYIRTLQDEYGFYSTLEQLMEQLPSNFVRCHRGFIVNSDRIGRVNSAQNIIVMDRKLVVPLSRSYKPEFRKFEKGKT